MQQTYFMRKSAQLQIPWVSYSTWTGCLRNQSTRTCHTVNSLLHRAWGTQD